MNAISRDNIFDSTAAWCWHPDQKVQEAGYTLFRRSFSCSQECSMQLAVSADNRYNLYLDGQLLGRGPCRSDLQHYCYEQYQTEVAAGTHILAIEVVVWRGGWRNSAAPWGEIHSGGGLVVDGWCGPERLDTPSNWRCHTDPGRMPLDWGQAWAAQIMTPIPPMDQIDFRAHDSDWADLNYDDSAWSYPVVIGQVCLRDSTRTDPSTPWLLESRKIGPLSSRFSAIAAIIEPGGAELTLSAGKVSGIIPAGAHRILLDIGQNQTSIVHFSGIGGQGKCRLAYAESLAHSGDNSNRLLIGENGYADLIIFAQKAWQYESFWYRTGRFVELDFELEEALELSNFSLDFFAYDFKLEADFNAPGVPWLESIWNVAWHTARCCAHEHYEDCPYYEQMQYAGDTRVQALISYAATGDGRLGRQALRHFDRSRLSSGITQSRYPNTFTQVIPEFSLIWILMVADYYRYFGDKEIISEHVNGIHDVLEYFEQRRNDDGLIGAVGHWNFTDWALNWPDGKIDRGTGEPETIINLFYAEASRAASQLFREICLPEKAEVFEIRRTLTINAVNALCFDPLRNVYRDVPFRDWFSCHTNALAIIADAASPEICTEIGNALVSNTSLTQGTLYFDFYVLEALKKCNLADGFIKKLTPWRQMLRYGFTTFPECPSLDTRSECHAWSASPVYEFITGLLGVSPAAPGFTDVKVAPLAPDGLVICGCVPIGGNGLLSIEVSDIELKISANTKVNIQLQHPSGRKEIFMLKPRELMKRQFERKYKQDILVSEDKFVSVRV